MYIKFIIIYLNTMKINNNIYKCPINNGLELYIKNANRIYVIISIRKGTVLLDGCPVGIKK